MAGGNLRPGHVARERASEVDDLIEAPDGETVVMALRVLLRLKRFEVDHEMPWAAVWIIRDGKLVWAQGYVHMADALEAAGLSE